MGAKLTMEPPPLAARKQLGSNISSMHRRYEQLQNEKINCLDKPDLYYHNLDISLGVSLQGYAVGSLLIFQKWLYMISQTATIRTDPRSCKLFQERNLQSNL